MLEKNIPNISLIIDQAPCHLTNKVNIALVSRNIKAQLIPIRLTNLLQPADVAWMHPLKKLYHQKWNNWLLNAPKFYTTAGNVKSPGYAQAIIWISQIWEKLDL